MKDYAVILKFDTSCIYLYYNKVQLFGISSNFKFIYLFSYLISMDWLFYPVIEIYFLSVCIKL